MNAAPPVHPVRLAALLALLAMFGPFAIDAFFPAFHAIEQDLHASPWMMQQTISVYLFAYAVMSLLHGALSDALGRRNVILAGVVVFTLASIGCALAQSIEQLLFFRVVQGMSTGAGQIVGRAMVRDLYDGPQAQKVMSLITLFFAIAPALAPLVGGLIFTVANWHAVFWFLAAYGAVLCLLCLRSLPETHPPEKRSPLRAGELLRVNQQLLRDGRFQLLVLCSGFNFSAQFLYISSTPALIENHLRLGTMGYSWFFVPMVLGMMAGAALSHRLAGKLDARATVWLGYGLMAAGGSANLIYNALVDPIAVPWAVLPIALNAVGVSVAFPTIALKALDRHPAHRGAASSMQSFLWGVMAAAVAAWLSPLVSHDHLVLAAGGVAMTLCGAVTWIAYVAITPPARRDATPAATPDEAVEVA